MPSLLPVALILSCALLGGYASLFTSIRDGFLEALRICTSSADCILSAPHLSHIPSYTSIPAVDSTLAILFEFFAQGITTDSTHGVDHEALLAVSYMAAQFGGAWYLLALEGLRRGSRGTILSWTGSFGTVVQVMTITIIAPIYLTVQLLISPGDVAVDALDLDMLPFSTSIAYILPSIGLALPLLKDISPGAKYLAIALWQPFPLYQTAIHTILRYIFRNKRQDKGGLRRAYKFVLWLTMGAHLLVVGTIIVSRAGFIPLLSVSKILSPGSLASPATLAMLDPPVSAAAARDIVVSFLRWDVYCASAAFVIWAAHLAPGGLPSRVAKVVFWTVVGGPVAPAVMLIWERDEAVLAKQAEAKGK